MISHNEKTFRIIVLLLLLSEIDAAAQRERETRELMIGLLELILLLTGVYRLLITEYSESLTMMTMMLFVLIHVIDRVDYTKLKACTDVVLPY